MGSAEYALLCACPQASENARAVNVIACTVHEIRISRGR